jgi:archaellum component FlaC
VEKGIKDQVEEIKDQVEEIKDQAEEIKDQAEEIKENNPHTFPKIKHSPLAPPFPK